MTHSTLDKLSLLEVRQLWNQALIEVRHLPLSGGSLTLGAKHGSSRPTWRSKFPSTLPIRMLQPRASRSGPDFMCDLPEPVIFASARRGHATLHLQPEWTLSGRLEGEPLTLDHLRSAGQVEPAEGALEIEVLPGQVLRVEVGLSVFEVRLVTEERAARPHMVTRLQRTLIREAPFIGLLALLGFIGLIFAAIVVIMPGSPEVDLAALNDRFTNMILSRQPPPPPRPEAPVVPSKQETAPAASARSTPVERRTPTEGRAAKAENDREVAEHAGVLGALSMYGEVSGSGGPISAGDLDGIGRHRATGVIGTSVSGVGSRRGDPGGSIDGIGSIGGTSGDCDEDCHRASTELGRKAVGTISATSEPIILDGQMDWRMVEVVIRRHYNAIRYCYQRQLMRSPGLAGKVVVKFTIAQDGTVSQTSIDQSSLGSPEVESCLTRLFLRMTFPDSPQGGIIVVRYPFMFTQG